MCYPCIWGNHAFFGIMTLVPSLPSGFLINTECFFTSGCGAWLLLVHLKDTVCMCARVYIQTYQHSHSHWNGDYSQSCNCRYRSHRCWCRFDHRGQCLMHTHQCLRTQFHHIKIWSVVAYFTHTSLVATSLSINRERCKSTSVKQHSTFTTVYDIHSLKLQDVAMNFLQYPLLKKNS